MSQNDLLEPILSRPRYGVLAVRPGSGHLMVADGEGAGAIIDLALDAAVLAATHIIYIPGANGVDRAAELQALGAAQFLRAPTFATALPRLQKVLADAHMGLQIYAAGTEGLMGQVQREVVAAGLPHTALQMEHRGSLARRVQCVHCKGITGNVMHDPFKCSHCGLNLFVRDHYSRRLAAFQGVNIDAEDPGSVPASVERFV
jgi:dimethylamine monooxygenase subunit C